MPDQSTLLCDFSFLSAIIGYSDRLLVLPWAFRIHGDFLVWLHCEITMHMGSGEGDFRLNFASSLLSAAAFSLIFSLSSVTVPTPVPFHTLTHQHADKHAEYEQRCDMTKLRLPAFKQGFLTRLIPIFPPPLLSRR